jgi:hypothetical protein
MNVVNFCSLDSFGRIFWRGLALDTGDSTHDATLDQEAVIRIELKRLFISPTP